MSGGVNTHALARSIRAMTVGTVADHAAMRDRIAELALQEIDQQYQLPIDGILAPGQVLTVTATVNFDAPFIDAYDQRHSYLSDPLFTYGTLVRTGPAVLISAHVRKWLQDEDDNYTGAQLQIVVYWPGMSFITYAGGDIGAFAGEVHLNFQGYGPPEPDDYGDD